MFVYAVGEIVSKEKVKSLTERRRRISRQQTYSVKCLPSNCQWKVELFSYKLKPHQEHLSTDVEANAQRFSTGSFSW